MGPFESPSLSESQKGTAFEDNNMGDSSWEVCVITEVYPERHTCAVITESNQFYTGVNWPGDGSKAPKRGKDYLVTHNAGKPVLIDAEGKSHLGVSVADYDVSIEDEIGGDDPAQDERGYGLAHEDQPDDMLPGDWVKAGDLGNLIGVLEGGTNVFKASEIAKIIASQAEHIVKILGKNISFLSEGATLEFETNDGKSSIILRAGKDSETSTHPSVEDFQVRCEIGEEGDMVDFRITDRKGRIKYRQHVDSDGRVDNVNQQEVKQTKGDKKETVEGDNTKNIEGQTNRTYRGEVQDEMGGNYRQTVGGSARIKAAKNMAMQAVENLSLSARKHIDLKTSGYVPGVDIDSAGPGDAWNVDVTNGNVAFDIGNPVNGDFFGGAKSSFNVNTYLGDMNFDSKGGSFKVKTLKPGSVNLGGPVPGTFSAVIYETLRVILEAFTTIFDVHTHQSNGQNKPTSPPATPSSPVIKPLLPLMKSRFVSFGG